MADRGAYRSIKVVLQDGPDFQRLTERARHTFLTLKMAFGPSGIEVRYFEALACEVAEKTGMPVEAARVSLQELERTGWTRRERNVVWIVGQLDHDPGLTATNENHRKSVQSHVNGLPRLSIVRRFVECHSGYFPPLEYTLPDGYPMASGGHDYATAITEDRITKNEERGGSTEDRNNTHTPRASDELSSWLGAHEPASDDYPLVRDPRTRRTLYQQYGPPGLNQIAWQGENGTPVPEPERPRIFANVLLGYATEGKSKIVTNEFAGAVRSAAKEFMRTRDGPTRDPWAIGPNDTHPNGNGA